MIKKETSLTLPESLGVIIDVAMVLRMRTSGE